MTGNWRKMTREAGTALAVLALYILVLLLPLHQAAGLQRDLDALGYSTLDAWSICQPLAQDQHGHPHEEPAFKCPAGSVAKQQLAAMLPPAITIDAPVATLVLRLAPDAIAPSALRPDHVGQSRAPPALV